MSLPDLIFIVLFLYIGWSTGFFQNLFSRVKELESKVESLEKKLK